MAVVSKCDQVCQHVSTLVQVGGSVQTDVNLILYYKVKTLFCTCSYNYKLSGITYKASSTYQVYLTYFRQYKVRYNNNSIYQYMHIISCISTQQHTSYIQHPTDIFISLPYIIIRMYNILYSTNTSRIYKNHY